MDFFVGRRRGGDGWGRSCWGGRGLIRRGRDLSTVRCLVQ